jgi:DNA-binding CsgD family transcriptional regulator
MFPASTIKTFNEIFYNHHCDVDESDYHRFELVKKILLRIAEVENSSLTVYDMNKKHYLILCSRFDELIGCQLFHDSQSNPEQLFRLMHPKDIPFVLDAVIRTFQFLGELPAAEKTDYKLIVDFRLMNSLGIYVRFIQQLVVLELDKNGQIWLVLKLIDLLSAEADQEPSQRKLLNIKTGKLCLFRDDLDQPSHKILSDRESEILGLISLGLDSRRISERLFISVNTVNNHRQNILSKTKTENTTQAILYAKKIGIV